MCITCLEKDSLIQISKYLKPAENIRQTFSKHSYNKSLISLLQLFIFFNYGKMQTYDPEIQCYKFTWCNVRINRS